MTTAAEDASLSGWRIKLYELDAQGAWLDRGTGYVDIRVESEPAPALVIVSEEDNSELLRSKVQLEDVYERQGENIIMWREKELSGDTDYALSFQESDGCLYIWKKVEEIQREYSQQREYGSTPSFAISSDGENIPQESLKASGNLQYLSATGEEEDVDSLPVECSIHTLNAIKERIYGAVHSYQSSRRDRLANAFIDKNGEYFQKFFQLFYELEKDKAANLEHLQRMHEVLRLTFFMNDVGVIEFLFSEDDYLRCVAGIFEYDRSLRQPRNCSSYREYLFGEAHCKEVVPMSHSLRETVIYLFRLRFLRDTMLHPTIDEPGISAINSIMTFATNQICVQLFSDAEYMRKVISLVIPTALSGTSTISQPSASSFTYDNSSRDRRSDTEAGLVSHDDSSGVDTDTGVIGKVEGSDLSVGSILPSDELSHIGTSTSLVTAVDAATFVRELFHLSRNIPLEKRLDMYRTFFAEMKQPFYRFLMFLLNGELHDSVGVLNSLNCSCRNKHSSGNSVDSGFNDNSSVGSIIIPLAADGLCAVCSDKYYTNMQSNRDSGRAIGAEILFNVTSIMPSLVRQWIQEGTIPSVNPLDSAMRQQLASFCSNENIILLLFSVRSSTDSSKSISKLEDTVRGLEQTERRSLLYVIINNLVNDNRCSSIEMLGDTLKILLDPQRTAETKLNETFIGNFYDYYTSWLLIPFLENFQPDLSTPLSLRLLNKGLRSSSGQGMDIASLSTQDRASISTSRRNIFEVLILCVQSHSYRIKYYILRNNIIARIINSSMCTNISSLHLLVVKFIKAVLMVKDDFYHRHIIKNDLFKQLFTAYKIVSSRDNAFTSAVYDLLEYIRTENLKLLIFYVVEKYDYAFTGNLLVQVYSNMKLRYEQLKDSEQSNLAVVGTADGNGRIRGYASSNPAVAQQNKRLREMDSEDDYFFGREDDEDEATGGSANSSYNSSGSEDLGGYLDEDKDNEEDDVYGPKPFCGSEKKTNPRFSLNAQELSKHLSSSSQNWRKLGDNGSHLLRSYSTSLQQEPSAASSLSYLDHYGEEEDEDKKYERIAENNKRLITSAPKTEYSVESIYSDDEDESDLNLKKSRVKEEDINAINSDIPLADRVVQDMKFRFNYDSTENLQKLADTSRDSTLPPLKPKYEDDEEVYSSVFLKNAVNRRSPQTKHITLESTDSNAVTGNNDRDGEEKATDEDKGKDNKSKPFSFSIRKKTRIN